MQRTKGKAMDEPVSTAAVDVQAEDLEVVVRHPALGELAFRTSENNIAEALRTQMSNARDNQTLRAAIAEIDARQLLAAQEITGIERRIEAAKVLADPVRIATEEEAKARIEASAQAMVEQRATLSERLK
jgi:hypothetical protein